MDIDTVVNWLQTDGLDLLIKLVVAIVIFVIGKWIARKITNLVNKAMGKANMDETLVSFLGNGVYMVLMVCVVLAALDYLGVKTTGFVAILGAAGLAVGLALQGSLANFASGVLIIMFRPFKKGDAVDGGGVFGIVEEITILTTVMRTPDNKVIIVPNSQIMGGAITNFSTKPTRRVDLVIGCGYDDDLKKVRSVLESILNDDERVLKDPSYTIGLSEIGDSSVNFVVRPWVNAADYWDVYFDVQEEVFNRFGEEGISIPYPQTDVHLFPAPSNDGDQAAS
ncbi:mechanosensitive ion channel [Opitutia bacterium ISCC 51]|nr:mechanosensitive ion channel [Opitutae bacterium ISCC 51]QXD29416.1 mechanosensitive ion channel [Opitutae bacterium ISCC 52]